MYFNNKKVSHVLGGGGLVSLVDGAVALLIQDLLGSSLDENVLLVFDEDRHAKSFFDALSFFKKSPVYYPGSKNQFRVPGFESEQNRARAGVIIKSVISGGVFCLSSKEAILNKDINKKLKLDKVSISLGKSFSIPFLIEKLVDFGYRNVEFVYHGGEFSSRGDIVDIYPESSKRPIRISFEFDVVESISYFNVDTQRSSRSCEFFTIYSLVGVSKTSGKNLLSFVPWSYVFYLKKRGDYWSFFSNSNKKMLKSHFKTISKPLLLDARFFKHITKNNRGKNFVFYTDPKRKGVLSKIGFSTIPGFLPGGCGVKLKNKTYFVDSVFLSKKPDVAVRKPLLINSLSQINPGDPVVHIVHGVARFSGLASRGRPGYEKEFVKLDYLDGSLFVSLDTLHLIHRYISPGGEPNYGFLGKSTWDKEVERVKKSIEDISQALLDLYMSRGVSRGFKYSNGFELLGGLKKSFPYKETEDQEKAIKDVQLDLGKNKPMDRLVCGDVGFGKTEVALRAIVRVSSSSKQSLFLCPTTVLADQHYITASERLEPLGVRVALLSRFATKQKQKIILGDLFSGRIDLVIGTHRLLSDDVVVPSLGLLIIDEEHRFGVKHKEKIRQLRFGLDVLSLSATPIPRTLQQSLLGIRDISMIETPPITRKAIETYVEYFSWSRIKEIMKTELLRGGQVYFLHNRVQTIEYYANKLQGFFPRYVVGTIHGKLNTKKLEKNLLSFFSGEISILVCSTIIESGLDVSNANCIIINGAQNLGLSQLYQIRGRVGRGDKQAQCFLIIPTKTKLSRRAFKRLKTIEKHTSLGSGYKVANSDLNIRGAGSLFGYKQSGQLAKIGFKYYNQLLKESINEKTNKKETVHQLEVYFEGKALIPKYYIESENQRLSFYNKINAAKEKKEVIEIKEELKDRFGKIPDETLCFIEVSLIRLAYKTTPVLKINIFKTLLSFELKRADVSDCFLNRVLDFGKKGHYRFSFKEKTGRAVIVLSVSQKQKWFPVLIDCLSVFLK